jgi:hypothetical protein
MPSAAVVEMLTCARQVANHAMRVGIVTSATAPRPTASHIGAVLADSVLQAGLNYRAVVEARIARIEACYPQASILSGVRAIVESGLTSDFLLWQHPTKIIRFNVLSGLLASEHVEDTNDLKFWLSEKGVRDRLLALNGIGPKTYDYMCCLVGIDRIAVDRHVRTFAIDAGVPITDYHELQYVVSCAADLLGLPRRDFDSWIWRHLSVGRHMRTAVQRFPPVPNEVESLI